MNPMTSRAATCGKCGRPVDPRSRFCRGCGAPVESPMTPGASVSAPMAPAAPIMPPVGAAPIAGPAASGPVSSQIQQELLPGEAVELNFEGKKGSVAVTHDRIVAVLYPNGRQSGHVVRCYVERKAARHVACGRLFNLLAMVLGILFGLSAAGLLIGSLNSGVAAQGIVALPVAVLAVVLIYFARSGTLVIRDLTGGAITVRLEPADLREAQQFASALGATVARR